MGNRTLRPHLDAPEFDQYWLFCGLQRDCLLDSSKLFRFICHPNSTLGQEESNESSCGLGTLGDGSIRSYCQYHLSLLSCVDLVSNTVLTHFLTKSQAL